MALSIRKLSLNGASDPQWKVGSTRIYIPDPNFKVEHTNLASSDSGRDAEGNTVVEFVRSDITKVYITYSYMSQTELNTMFNLLQGKKGFNFTFPDRGSNKTIKAYCGQCSYEMYTENYRGSGEALYANVSFNVIEM